MKHVIKTTADSGFLISDDSTFAVEAERFGFANGSRVRVTIEDEPKQRTERQNARYWGVIIPAFAEWTGYEPSTAHAESLGLTSKDSAHETLKAMFLEPVSVTLPNGKTVHVMPSTASLTVAQFAEYQERVERFLNSEGIYLPQHEVTV